MHDRSIEYYDVVIAGGGPAGLQAALVTVRAGKKTVVFDDPLPPRNSASRGVHNMIGLDGLSPSQFRETIWKQITVYRNAALREECVIDISRGKSGLFLVTGSNGTKIETEKVILALGYRDIYPDVPGFLECWGRTIINCPYCDGYENKGRVWGFVPGNLKELSSFPKLSLNWTDEIIVFLPHGMGIDEGHRQELMVSGIKIQEGIITAIHNTDGRIDAVTLDTGDKTAVGTLLWIPPREPVPLLNIMVETLGLILDESEQVVTDGSNCTNVPGIWAAGEVRQCCSNALDSAADGSKTAKSVLFGWH
jgi:thioredoxin reductase